MPSGSERRKRRSRSRWDGGTWRHRRHRRRRPGGRNRRCGGGLLRWSLSGRRFSRRRSGLHGLLGRSLRRLFRGFLRRTLLGGDLDAALFPRRGCLPRLGLFSFLRFRLLRHDRPPDRSAAYRSRATRRSPRLVRQLRSLFPRTRPNARFRPYPLAFSKPPAPGRRSPSRSARPDGQPGSRCPQRSA